MDLPQFSTWLKEKDLVGFWELSFHQGERRRGGPKAKYRPYLWKWQDMSTALQNAMELVSPEDSYRRFIGYVHPELKAGPSHTITLGAQLVKPGEEPVAHRHTLAALRFVIQGRGAVTVINGEEFPMEEGDLITTPKMTWHEHHNRSSQPIVWLDALDSPLLGHLQVGTGEVYPKPFQEVRRPTGMSSAEAGAARPSWVRTGGRQPAPFRYSWEETRKVLELMVEESGDPFDGLCLQYVNPATGGATLPTISCQMQMLRPSEVTQTHRHTSTVIYHAFRGKGRIVIEDEIFDWEAGDTFVVPLWCDHRHENPFGEPAYLFSLTDRPVMDALGLYEEETG